MVNIPIEEYVRNYLLTKTDIPVVVEVPEDPPEQFFRIEKTGSSEAEGLIVTESLAIQSYGKTLADSAKLNLLGKSYMRYMEDLNDVSAVYIDTDYPFTDVSRKRSRYQMVCRIVHY